MCGKGCVSATLDYAGRHTQTNGLLWEVVVILSLFLSDKLQSAQFVLPLLLFLLTFSSFVPQYFDFLLQLKNSCTHARSLAHTYTLIMLQSIVWPFFECRTMVSQGVMLCNMPETAKWVFQKWWEAGSRTGNVLYFDLPQHIIVFFSKWWFCFSTVVVVKLPWYLQCIQKV